MDNQAEYLQEKGKLPVVEFTLLIMMSTRPQPLPMTGLVSAPMTILMMIPISPTLKEKMMMLRRPTRQSGISPHE